MYLSKDQIKQLFDGIHPSLHLGTILVLKENVIKKDLVKKMEVEKEDENIVYYARTVAEYVKIMEDIGFKPLYDVEFHDVPASWCSETMGSKKKLLKWCDIAQMTFIAEIAEFNHSEANR